MTMFHRIKRKENQVNVEVENNTKVRAKEFNWEVHQLDMINASERKAWLVAKCAMACSILFAGAIFMLTPLKTVVPFVIQTDKTTGLSTVLHLANADDIPVSEMMNKYWVSEYVKAREGYDWRTLEQEYITVRELSLPNVFDVYASQYGVDKKDSIENKLKDDFRVRVELKSVVINNDHVATVRFSKITFDNKTGKEKARNHWTATLAWEYFPEFEVPEERRIINPFGFKITSYRVDPELVGDRGEKNERS